MKTIAPDTEGEAENPDFKPLTAAQARQWRGRHPQLAAWQVVTGQALVGMLAALAALAARAGTGSAAVGWSLAYGVLAVAAPAALFAYAVLRYRPGRGARAALLGFAAWEATKIALTLALLAAAPLLVPDLSWMALLAGMVVATQMYWVALWVRPGVRKTVCIRYRPESSDVRTSTSTSTDCK